jgi:uncharacterized protein YndB with AHSA1/START domain
MTSRLLVALRVRSTPARAFDAFTKEIDQWWRPNGLFQFTPNKVGRLAFEPGPDGRLTETTGDEVFEIGRIRVWEPPTRLSFSWRQASFSPGQLTEVHVRFEPVGDETRVTVEHIGWDAIPQDHAARHGLPLSVFQRRHADWWRRLLTALKQRIDQPSA